MQRLWVAANTGWGPQWQTHFVTAGPGTNWTTPAKSSATRQFPVPLAPAGGGVFPGLDHPQFDPHPNP